MPFSLRDNNDDVRDYVIDNEIETFLDVGPGFGTYARILQDLIPRENRYAVEVFAPYVGTYGLMRLYERVWINDIREVAIRGDLIPDQFDLIIFGDVLEHMSREDALYVWKWASEHSKHGLISVPTIHWPQAGNDNPNEAHVQEHMHVEDVIADYGPFDQVFEYEQTATFIRRF